MQSFNAGNYQASVAASNEASNITMVLYPNDNMWAGKELRLKQQYLWCCASLQDILRRFRSKLKALARVRSLINPVSQSWICHGAHYRTWWPSS